MSQKAGILYRTIKRSLYELQRQFGWQRGISFVPCYVWGRRFFFYAMENIFMVLKVTPVGCEGIGSEDALRV